MSTCKSDHSLINNYMIQNYSDIAYKKVAFPQDNFIKISDNKTSLKSYNLKLLFLGNMNCSPCVIKLKEIQKYLNSNSYIKDNVDVIYLGLGELTEYFNYQVKENNFSFTIYADVNSVFIEQNKLHKYTESTFLLNDKNEIILIGDVINNKQLQSFYKELILK